MSKLSSVVKSHPVFGEIRRVGFDGIRVGMHLVHIVEGDLGTVEAIDHPKWEVNDRINVTIHLSSGRKLKRARHVGKSLWRIV